MQTQAVSYIRERHPSRTPAGVPRGEGPREVLGLPSRAALVEVLLVILLRVPLLHGGTPPAHHLGDDLHPQRSREPHAAWQGSRAQLRLLAVAVPDLPTQTRAPDLSSRLATVAAARQEGGHNSCGRGALPPEPVCRGRGVAAGGAVSSRGFHRQ